MGSHFKAKQRIPIGDFKVVEEASRKNMQKKRDRAGKREAKLIKGVKNVERAC